MRLLPFQRTMLRDYFDGATESLILVPKKNSKSTTLAALSLFHLVTTPDAECVIAAASRDQATILYDQAAGFVRRSEGMQLRVDVKRGYREIRSRRGSGRIRVLAADVDTADGVIPTLALVDELHRHKSAELYGVFRDGLGPRDGRMITISTAGDDELSPLGQVRAAAYELPDQRRDGAHRYCRSADHSYVMHEWALDPGEDLDDMNVVKTANPAPWHTIASLRRRHDSPSMTPWQWARFACNVWSQGEEAWLPNGAWAGCLEGDATIPDGADVVLGVDVGTKHDTSAVVRLWRRDDGRVVVEAEVFAPRGDGTALELAVVEQAIRDNADRFTVRAVVYDRWSFERSAQELSDRGLLMIEQPMSPERMTLASQQLYEAIIGGEIAHDGDPVLAAHVNAGAVKPTERGWRLVKNKARRPIDALIAMALAYTQVAKPHERPRFEVLA